MVVATTNYGNWATHVGTLAEVMAEITGKVRSHVIAIYYDVGASKHVAVVHGL